MVSEIMHKSPAKLILFSLCLPGFTLLPAFAQSAATADSGAAAPLSVPAATQAAYTPSVASAVRHQYDRLCVGAEDLITVRVFAADDIPDKPAQIDNDGTVTLPMIGRVQAAGLTVEQFQANLVTRLQEVFQGSASHRAGERIPQPAGVGGG